MSEEQVTKAIMLFLKEKDWAIMSYDFPQSGTGKVLRSSVNPKKSIIPDIICTKGNLCILFENKNKFVPSDFVKLNNLKISDEYKCALDKFLGTCDYILKVATGFPAHPEITSAMRERFALVDYVFLVEESSISILGDFV